MSAIQHSAAEKLLPVIIAATRAGLPLNYQLAAEKIGRPRDNARMVAQVCDLLDAAAAYAGTPLLALVAVREKSGNINRAAWAEWGHREQIIECSLQHKFSEGDFIAIGKALKELEGKSNRTAWEFVRRTVPPDELIHRLTKVPFSDFSDAIDDIGADFPERIVASVTTYMRDPKIRKAVKARARGKCEFCGEIGFIGWDGASYLECHHIVALANDGADRMTNVIALCANDHREAHFGNRRVELEKAMIEKVRLLEK